MFPGEDKLRGVAMPTSTGDRREGPETGVACGIQHMRVVMQSVSYKYKYESDIVL